MRNISNTLCFRLLCLLLIVSAIVFISLTAFIIRTNKQHVMREAVRTNKLLLRSMRQSMLLNRLEDVAQTIETLGSGPGIYGIRIYDKVGSVVFSGSASEIGQKADLEAEQCIVCHSGKKPLEYISEVDRTRIFASPKGYRILGVFEPIRNEPACAAPSCHSPPSEQKILGMLDSEFYLAQVGQSIFSSRNLMVLYSIGAILVIELFAGLFIIRKVQTRLVKLAEGTRQVREGNLDFGIQVEGNDEIADLGRSFNTMVASLKRAEDENAKLSQKMVHVAKMASMCQLAATVAHEINNPLGGVLAYSRVISRKVSAGPITDEEREQVLRYLETVITEARRCGSIIKNLLDFSRSSESVMEEVDIHDLIEKSLSITKYHLELKGIRTITNLEAKSPNFIGNPNQITQALIALFTNAVEAMRRDGVLTVATLDLEGRNAVRVRVMDNGRGIPREIRSSIFEPFFTTKEDGHSVGLGLSVVYGIMARHQGKIELESEPGQGTTFVLTFPRQIKLQGYKEPILDGPVVLDL